MSFSALWVLAVGMSMDAFAAAVVKGAQQRPTPAQTVRTALLFGTVEAIAPVIGWLGGQAAQSLIRHWDHWIAFGLLSFLGLRMLYSGLSPAADNPSVSVRHAERGAWLMLLTAIGTSVDSMVAGIGLAFLNVDIVMAALMIGVVTALMCAVGMVLGRVLGAAAGQRAEIAGGLVLIGIGANILWEHLHGLA